MDIPYGPILVVEDIPHVLELIEVTLRRKGYLVAIAHNGQEALEMVQEVHPSLVITDILLPKMDGFSLAHKLRKDPTTDQLPVIFLSAIYVTPEDKNFALSLGAVRFIEKPVDTKNLLLTVTEILAKDATAIANPLSEREFYQGYRHRLEMKMRHKTGQINRTERLLQTQPGSQKLAFEALLEQATSDRKEIQKELDQLYALLSNYNQEMGQA